MRSLISFLTLLVIKGLANIFYRFEVNWPQDNKIVWNEVRLVIFLNHTSLMEPIYLGILPISFLRMLSKRMVAPGADKTMKRPIVGMLFKLFSPGMVAITRKRDNSWQQFMDAIYEDSIIVIAAEGRMKRRTGLDLAGKKMTVRLGAAEILAGLKSGQMVFAYSGGLHHVQAPGEGLPKVFKKLKMNIDVVDIAAYKASFGEESGTNAWKKKVIGDMQHRLETRPPTFD